MKDGTQSSSLAQFSSGSTALRAPPSPVAGSSGVAICPAGRIRRVITRRSWGNADVVGRPPYQEPLEIGRWLLMGMPTRYHAREEFDVCNR